MKKPANYIFKAYKQSVVSGPDERSFYDPIGVEVMANSRAEALKEAKQYVDDPERTLDLIEIKEL